MMDRWMEVVGSTRVIWRVRRKGRTAHARTVIGTRDGVSCYAEGCVAGDGVRGAVR